MPPRLQTRNRMLGTMASLRALRHVAFRALTSAPEVPIEVVGVIQARHSGTFVVKLDSGREVKAGSAGKLKSVRRHLQPGSRVRLAFDPDVGLEEQRPKIVAFEGSD